MKRLVCDTGPLNYLIQIEAVELLPALFQQILIPDSVYHELMAPAAPAQVRAWSRQLPAWCLIHTANRKLDLYSEVLRRSNSGNNLENG